MVRRGLMMEKHSKSKLILNFLLMVVVIGVILVIMKNSLGDIFAQIGRTKPVVLLGITALGLLFLCLEGYNYRRIVAPFSLDLSFSQGFFAFCYPAFYRLITFGAGTLVAEVMYFRQRGLTTSQGMGVTSIHMMLYKLGVISMSSLGLLLSYSTLSTKMAYMIPAVIIGLVITSLIVVVLFLASANQRFHQWLLKLANRFFTSKKWQQRIQSFNEQIVSLRETVREIMTDRSNVIKLVGVNVLKLIPWYIMPFVIFYHEYQLPLVLSVSLVAMASVVGGVIPSPAGIGSFDFIFVLLFSPLVGRVDAASGLLLYRFGTYVLPVLLGMLFVARNKEQELKEEIHELKETKM